MNAGEVLPTRSNHETGVAIRTMALIIGITIVAEMVTMGLLAAFGMLEYHTFGTALLDALVLSALIAPPIYWLVLRPIRREYQRRLEAESRADDLGKLAITDPLTRCMNRRGITVALLDAMAQAERYGTPLAVAFADIDHFKSINDDYGHDAGDKVLITVASALADSLRMPDKVGRYGGEEFLIVLPHTSLAPAKKIIDRIRGSIGNARTAIDGKKIKATISMGVTQFKKGEDLEKLLARADQALYTSKQAGRNRVTASK
jgi:diguanylate cyclase (GGDEF)-like protein